MVSSERDISAEGSRRNVVILVAVIAALVIGILFYFLLRATGSGSAPPSVPGMVRAGSTEFEQSKARIVLDEPEAEKAGRALGDIVMTIHSIARNFTGKTIDGLEVKASVVDHQGKPVKEKTVVVIPTRQPELPPNKTMLVQVMIDGLSDSDDIANIKMEVTGFKLK